MSFDRFVKALDGNAALESVSVTGLATLDTDRAEVLQLSMDSKGESWIELPKTLIESIEVTGYGEEVGKDYRYPRVNARLSDRQGDNAIVTALFKLLAIEGRHGAALWHDARRGVSFDEFAKAMASNSTPYQVTVTGWAKIDPERTSEMQFSPTMNCDEWLSLPKSLIGSIDVLGLRSCNGDHNHPVVAFVLSDPGISNPAAQALFAILAHRQLTARSSGRSPDGGSTERCEHGHGKRCENHPDGTSTLEKWYCDGSGSLQHFTGPNCKNLIGSNFTFDSAITPAQVSKLLERHRFAYSRIWECGNLSSDERVQLDKKYQESIHHGISTDPNVNASAFIGGNRIDVNFGNLFPQGDVAIAQTLIHEMMHCAGYNHPKDRVKPPAGQPCNSSLGHDCPFDNGKYYGTPPLRAELCIAGSQDDAMRIRQNSVENTCVIDETGRCSLYRETATHGGVRPLM